jgi:hypothetical protein
MREVFLRSLTDDRHEQRVTNCKDVIQIIGSVNTQWRRYERHLLRFNKTGIVRINVNIEVRSRHHCYCGNAISIKYSECVSVLLF